MSLPNPWMRLQKNYYICDECSAHSPYPFKKCPSCGSGSIRQHRLWERYFKNEFIPVFKIYLEANEVYCPCCYPKLNELNLVVRTRKKKAYPDKYYACTSCGYGVKTTNLSANINTVFDPSYRCDGKKLLISIQEIGLGGKRLVIVKKVRNKTKT